MGNTRGLSAILDSAGEGAVRLGEILLGEQLQLQVGVRGVVHLQNNLLVPNHQAQSVEVVIGAPSVHLTPHSNALVSQVVDRVSPASSIEEQHTENKSVTTKG